MCYVFSFSDLAVMFLLLGKCLTTGSYADTSFWLQPSEATVLLNLPPTLPDVRISDWSQYYKWRGLSLGSPIAAILSYPLTLYFILSTCLKFDGKINIAL